MTAGIAAPAGDSAPRLRLKRLVGPKGSFRRVRRPHNMNDNILYHALGLAIRLPHPTAQTPPFPSTAGSDYQPTTK